MGDNKPTRSGRLSREERLAGVLSILQAEVEKAPGGEGAKRMRRQVLRGLRLATWLLSGRTTIAEVEFEFRNELFNGQSPIK
jgi:hypothetical protein